jgi:L-aspartate oxidase
VLGSGIAGLRAAIALARHGQVLVATKDDPVESNTGYAQGGVAVAMGSDDEPALHLEDTLRAGAGLVCRAAAEVLVEEGPERIRELSAWGARFDRDLGRVQFTREAAHSRSRVLHALGDATGWEMLRALLERSRTTPGLTVRGTACCTDLLVEGGRVIGCRFVSGGASFEVLARATLIATGGAGQVFAETTNPEVATGDGIAMALRAGARLADLEFVQFHPTALAVPGSPRFLVSEAVRGEGAYLRNGKGDRFVDELRPRDQVARAIDSELREGRGPVSLDLRHLGAERVRSRFPRICATCQRHGIDATTDPVPVSPAAHYLMGGIATDLDGRSSLPGLWAAGEAACTGVHGANRLASNSLLEGLVFGARAGASMAAHAGPEPAAPASLGEPSVAEVPGLREELRRRAWLQLGLVREAAGLRALIEFLEPRRQPAPPADRAAAELRNLVDLTHAMARCALFREESRGGHYRSDFPDTEARFAAHTWLDAGGVRLGEGASVLGAIPELPR